MYAQVFFRQGLAMLPKPASSSQFSCPSFSKSLGIESMPSRWPQSSYNAPVWFELNSIKLLKNNRYQLFTNNSKLFKEQESVQTCSTKQALSNTKTRQENNNNNKKLQTNIPVHGARLTILCATPPCYAECCTALLSWTAYQSGSCPNPSLINLLIVLGGSVFPIINHDTNPFAHIP